MSDALRKNPRLSIACLSSPVTPIAHTVNTAPTALAWNTTSACDAGSGTSNSRRSSKFAANESKNKAATIKPTPRGSNDGRASTSPIVNSAMPATNNDAARYSFKPYRLPCTTVPMIIVGITFEDFATILVV